MRTLGTYAAMSLALSVAIVVPGCAGTPVAQPAPRAGTAERGSAMFTLSSSAFNDGRRIPLAYIRAGGGRDRSIPLAWSGAPTGTASFAVTVVDHAPVAHMWVHWAVVDIPPSATGLPDGASGTSAMPAGARELDSTYGTRGYGGPNPPAGTGEHPYVATVYALSVPSLDVPAKATAGDLARAMSGKVLAEASVTGVYSR